MQSAFFNPGPTTTEGQIASLHLSRDQQLPVQLTTVASRAEDQGYAEGVVTNTRFGSFPHSTLIDIPWGCQVLASKVDTGTRGRDNFTHSRKRKANAISTDSPTDSTESASLKQATAANSGFIHVLPPTPESWTTSLPHRTQVVYTPDYSYVLQQIRAQPGSTLIEAGSGSGSFTHAAARAVFQGAPTSLNNASKTEEMHTAGKVFTFEFHAERHEKVKTEMEEHGLDSIVTATHRDVYKDGFWLTGERGAYQSPRANCIFLDLPAPWEALPHLTRQDTPDKPSALDPDSTAYVCTFSPCIEQVQRTVSTMRRLSWLEIEMVEIQHKRIEVKREYTGLKYEGMRGVNPVAATVDEALERLRQVEENAREHQQDTRNKSRSKNGVQQNNSSESAVQKHWDEGKLIHRAEPELKTHTSYLVFAVLPREWTEEDEATARARTGQIDGQSQPKTGPKSQKQRKKDSRIRAGQANGNVGQVDGGLPNASP
ncbi:tRNA (adenine-N(1)-)-methyltransferase catalytic subunit trm61 [Lithohypha guttulata]|uniref:tRNA (adenine(58)-N(1))-methyltransferase catalytic subunit TRM61 n=1 Tax=Lithohypha guttulata TaxID=1690604 RepID=A0ABR0JYR1_9EURO|nr:tRNA (adenine-N(1)-)-methyltransferase catalytic subunit trm61 [Lithohypha guttulata]